MQPGFSNRHDFATAAFGLAVWAAHFTFGWGASIALPGDPAARWLAIPATIAAFAALYRLWRRAGSPSWHTVPGLGLAIAAAGTAFDTLPALVG